LNLPVDPALIERDFKKVEATQWRAEEPYRFEGFFGSEIKVYHNGEWVGLGLRSQGGSVQRTDPGGPGLDEFEDTPLMECTPYIAELLRALKCPIRSVRLLRLPPGGVIAEHRDTYHGFEYGQLRLHVPVVTSDAVETYVRDRRWHWRPGDLWYADFGSLHSVRNGGESARVHLVIDVLVTPHLLTLFPPEFDFSTVDVLFDKDCMQLDPAALRECECDFSLPSTLVKGIFDIDDGIVGQLDAGFRMNGDHLIWTVDGRDAVRLVPLSRRRFRFAGWTMERYFEVAVNHGRVSRVDLVLRRGQQATRIAMPTSDGGVRAVAAP
jgi:hypothetical protein